jgi:hypothetical protein
MALFIAYNAAFSATTDVAAGTSYASGAKCAIQLDVPSTMRLQILEWGVSFDGSTAATPALVELVQASAASTMSTAHTSSTVLATGADGTATSRLNYGTTADTGYGNGAITSNTTELVFDKQYIAPTNQYIKMWPLGDYPMCDAGKFVQLRIKTTATVNALAYIRFRELSA